MKRTLILTILILFISMTIHTREYLIKQTIPDAGHNETNRNRYSHKLINLGNYYPKLMIPTSSSSDWYRTKVYSFTGDSFVFETNIDSLRITDVGDFDNDGLPELLGYSIAYDKRIAVMEQQDTNQIYSTRTWESDSLNHGMAYLASTNLIKTVGVDRILIADPPNSDDGWGYMSSSGDNSYYFDYELIEDREIGTMDIGYLDDDSLVDIIAGTGKGQTWWEATDSGQDSFNMIHSNIEGGPGTHYSLYVGDLDKDGLNEFMIGGLVYLTSPAWWEFNIVEWKSDTICEEIFQDTITKDYGYLENFYSGSDVDYGDVDGDGEDEIVWCAGCILTVYEIAGNDSFVRTWQMDNDTFSGSHVRVYDFNKMV